MIDYYTDFDHLYVLPYKKIAFVSSDEDNFGTQQVTKAENEGLVVEHVRVNSTLAILAGLLEDGYSYGNNPSFIIDGAQKIQGLADTVRVKAGRVAKMQKAA